MLKKPILLSLFCGFFLFAFLAAGNCEYNKVVIFGNDNKPPKVYLENNLPKGILIDILKYLEKDTEYSFDIRLYPWKRSYHYALKGEGGIIGLSKNTERLELFDYSDVIFYEEMVLVVLKGNEFPYNSMEDLRGKKLGVSRGASYGDAFEKGKRTVFSVDEDTSQVTRLKKLLHKRFDVALIGPGKMGFEHAIRQDSELLGRRDEFVILSKPLAIDPNFLGFSKTMKKKDFLAAFNKALEKGHKTGAIQKIIDKYAAAPSNNAVQDEPAFKE